MDALAITSRQLPGRTLLHLRLRPDAVVDQGQIEGDPLLQQEMEERRRIEPMGEGEEVVTAVKLLC
jgi:hypothetical protein